MVKRSVGPRTKTRHKLAKKPRLRGLPPPSHALRDFAAGTKVDVVINPSVHGGMPHSRFHGLTGTVQEKQGQCFVVEVYVGNKPKVIVTRPEHIRLSSVQPKAAPKGG